MIKFLNIRGSNGAGKTTLMRCLARSPECRLVPVHQPLHRAEDKGVKPEKVGKPKGKPIVATVTPEGIALLGDYTPAAVGTTAGCDRISRQDDVKAALVAAAAIPGVELVIFEGIIVGTIYGPWQEWSKANGGMIWAFLDTPLEVCLKRIQERNGGKPIKEDQVADKHRTIARVREKALADGETVRDIHWETALKDLKAILEEAK
jgi:predicted ABC-type ATPase